MKQFFSLRIRVDIPSEQQQQQQQIQTVQHQQVYLQQQQQHKQQQQQQQQEKAEQKPHQIIFSDYAPVPIQKGVSNFFNQLILWTVDTYSCLQFLLFCPYHKGN